MTVVGTIFRGQLRPVLLAVAVLLAGCDDDSTPADSGADATLDQQGVGEQGRPDIASDQQGTPEGGSPDTVGDRAVEGGTGTCGCATDEICVRFFDGVCIDLGHKCVKLPTSCQGAPCSQCPELVCGGPDGGGLVWACDYAPCPTPDSGIAPPFDHACYGP